MEKLFNSKTVGSIFLMLTVFLTSCKQDLTVPTPSVETPTQVQDDKITELNLQGVKLENGIMHFESLETLDRATELLKKSNFASYLNWSSSQNFKSLAVLKDELNEEFSMLKTEEEVQNFALKNSDIIELLSDSSFIMNNPHLNLHPFLNRESMIKIGKDLFVFDKKGEIIVRDGDVNKMRKAMVNRTNEYGIIVFSNMNNKLQTRSTCDPKTNYSGLQYGDSGRRASVTIAQTWQNFPNPSGYTFTARAILNVATAAQKRTLGVYYNYSTPQLLKIQLELEVPTPIRGGGAPVVFFYDRLNSNPLSGNVQSLAHVLTVKEWLFIQSTDVLLNVESKFITVDYFYSNQGGVNIEFHCS